MPPPTTITRTCSASDVGLQPKSFPQWIQRRFGGTTYVRQILSPPPTHTADGRLRQGVQRRKSTGRRPPVSRVRTGSCTGLLLTAADKMATVGVRIPLLEAEPELARFMSAEEQEAA